MPPATLTRHIFYFALRDLGLGRAARVGIEPNDVSDHLEPLVGYIPPEYGTGVKVPTQGDVYSYGILLLEMSTGKTPTDSTFKDGATLQEYSLTVIPKLVMEIVDINVLSKFHEEISATKDQLRGSSISIVGVGVACSMEIMT